MTLKKDPFFSLDQGAGKGALRHTHVFEEREEFKGEKAIPSSQGVYPTLKEGAHTRREEVL